MTNSFRNTLIAFSIATVVSLSTAQAAVFCVTNTAELQAALDQADSNSQDDEIRIEEGVYDVPQGASFTYRGGTSLGGDNNDLSIIGGWIPFGGNSCARLRSNASALDTILNGDGREQVLLIDAGEQSSVSITGISFLSGNPSGNGTTRGGGLRIRSLDGAAETFLIERTAFISNTADFSAAASISGSRVTRFVNNLVVGNTNSTATAVVNLIQNDQTGVYAINNTVINNSSEETAIPLRPTGLRVAVNGSSQALVANNILWGNEFGDIDYDGSGLITSRNNTIEASLGAADISQNNVSIAPEFEADGFLDFNLVPSSPLADFGLNPPPTPISSVFELNWALPDNDLDGGPRRTNDGVDLGAYETPQDGIFSDRFE